MKRIMPALLGALLAAAVGVAQAQGAAGKGAEKSAGKGAAAEAPKGPSADDKARDRALANYRKNKGMATDAKPAAMGAKAAAKK